jgi:hypothetical protein
VPNSKHSRQPGQAPLSCGNLRKTGLCNLLIPTVPVDRSAHRLLYPTAVRRRTCQTDRSQVGGGLQLLALRRLPPHEPPIPVAYPLAQLGPLNTELSAAGGSALQVRVALTASLLCLPKVLLRVWWYEQDGLLICAVSSDDAVADVVLMISPSYSHRATPQPRPSDP